MQALLQFTYCMENYANEIEVWMRKNITEYRCPSGRVTGSSDHYALVLKPGITVCYDTPSPGHVAYFCLGTEFVSRNAQYF